MIFSERHPKKQPFQIDFVLLSSLLAIFMMTLTDTHIFPSHLRGAHAWPFWYAVPPEDHIIQTM
jgi:hypothetical protein